MDLNRLLVCLQFVTILIFCVGIWRNYKARRKFNEYYFKLTEREIKVTVNEAKLMQYEKELKDAWLNFQRIRNGGSSVVGDEV